MDEKYFFTYVPNNYQDICNDISFRIRPVEILSKKKMVVSLLRDRERLLSYKFELIFRIMFSLITKNQIARKFTIDLMVNQKPAFGSHLTIDDTYPTKKVNIDSKLSKNCLNLMKKLIHDLDSLVEAVSDSGNKIKFFERISEASLNDVNSFRDAAHWYGTVPMSEKNGLIDSSFESNDVSNLFAIGASGFVEGSVGHPTLLAMFTAEKASRDLLRRTTK